MCHGIGQKTREGCGCPKFLAGRVFWQISTLLENSSPPFREHDMLSLPRFGHFSARKMTVGKLAPPSGTLPVLDLLLRNRRSLFLIGETRKGPPFRGLRSHRTTKTFRMQAVTCVVPKLHGGKAASLCKKRVVAKLQGDI